LFLPPYTPQPTPYVTHYSDSSEKLPHSSAADHAGWRYEHIMWAATLDAGRSRPPDDALDSLDACDSFVAGRGALSIIALIRFAFNGGIPPASRP